jgi:GH15 family glucan-1,4-alpha-glucosidase
MRIIDTSIAVILNNQHQSGAYIACPNFETYQFGWFRDGAYIAYAMDLFGYHNSSARFFDWCAALIEKNRDKILQAIQNPTKVLENSRINALHCRFTPEGEEIVSGWSTHQLDGLGIWLWSLVQHCRLSGNDAVPEKWLPAVQLVGKYIETLWRYPCADCWEENDDQIHTYTLASLAGGLKAYQDFMHDDRWRDTLFQIKQMIGESCLTSFGTYKKSTRFDKVDANLMGLVFPFEVVEAENPIFLKTLEKIEQDLRVSGGGLRRYLGDQYYGGGEWVLLTAWLGCIYIELGRVDAAEQIKQWIENQADRDGGLPEQVTEHVQDKDSLEKWSKKWGVPAAPLLWSHANYLILCHMLYKCNEVT